MSLRLSSLDMPMRVIRFPPSDGTAIAFRRDLRMGSPLSTINEMGSREPSARFSREGIRGRGGQGRDGGSAASEAGRRIQAALFNFGYLANAVLSTDDVL